MATLFIHEIRKRTKGTHIVQMSDIDTGRVEGVDSVHRCESWPFGVWYYDAMLSFPAKEFLRLDYDCVILRDVEGVFALDFDVAIAKERDLVMNNGVVFVKDKAIFEEAKRAYLKSEQDNWMDIQIAMQAAIDTGSFKVRKLALSYNQPFKRSRPVPEETKILHFKGAMKSEMLDYCYDRWQPLVR